MGEYSRRSVLRAAVLAASGGFALGSPALGAGKASARHPFLEGRFAPVRDETTAFDLPVSGRVPPELNGRYLRTGPNVLGLEDPRVHHWMSGEGMVHGVRLRSGRAEWYRNRWVRSADVARKLGEPYPGPVPPGDFANNTCVISANGRILALQEGGPMPYELDGELNTIGPCDFGGTLNGSYAAHTKYDPRADELHAITYRGGENSLRHLVVDSTGKVARTRVIPMRTSVMLHDFALTENHVVLFDLPVTFDPSWSRPTPRRPIPWTWNDRYVPRLGVLPRSGGRVRWFDMAPVYYSHTLNGYERDGEIVVEMTTFPAPFYVAGTGNGGPAAGGGSSSLDRWTIDLNRDSVRVERLDDRPQEFPRVPESVVSRPHRYGYSAFAPEMFQAYQAIDGAPPDHAFSNMLIKHDMTRGTSEVHRFPRGAATSEPVFAPSSEHDASAAEDDGYVLAYVHNPRRAAADLVILAAQDFAGEPVATIHLPARVPLGFHGSWIADT